MRWPSTAASCISCVAGATASSENSTREVALSTTRSMHLHLAGEHEVAAKNHALRAHDAAQAHAGVVVGQFAGGQLLFGQQVLQALAFHHRQPGT
jgi:hypothetical protein